MIEQEGLSHILVKVLVQSEISSLGSHTKHGKRSEMVAFFQLIPIFLYFLIFYILICVYIYFN